MYDSESRRAGSREPGEAAPEKDNQGNGGSRPPKQHTPWHTLSARVISLVSRKGGVGKTTSAVNLGAALALSGHSVLLVGVDSQCGVSRSLGYGPEELDGGLESIFGGDRSLTDLAYTTPLKNLFFVAPRVSTLREEETFLEQMEARVDTFVREIDRARNLYDTIIIDCPPGLNACTRAALLASQSYLVPIQAEELCRVSLDSLLGFIEAFRDEAYAGAWPQETGTGSRALRLEGLFLTMVASRTRMSRHVVERVRQDHGAELFATGIPRTTRLAEMALRGKPAVIYDRRSPGSRAYFDLMDELVSRHAARSADASGDGPSAETASLQEETADVHSAEGATGVGMSRLLAELRASLPAAGPAGEAEPAATPELVSLDDLLAEEERSAWEESDWEEPRWGREPDPDGRYH